MLRMFRRSAKWQIPAPGHPMWDAVMRKVISGRIPFRRAARCRRMVIYAMDISGREVTLHCIDIDGDYCRADVKVDAALLARLTEAAKVALCD